VTDLEALRSKLGRNRPQRHPSGLQDGYLFNGCLLSLVAHQLAALAQPVTERHDASQISAPGFLVGLHLSNALPDAVALCFGKSSSDRQEKLADAVAGDVAAEIEQVQLDAPEITSSQCSLRA
jgi:hypothetical protein